MEEKGVYAVENRRKMPVVIRRIEMGEGPYSGWWAEMRVNPPQRVITALTNDFDEAEFLKLVTAWNFVDEDGADMQPATAAPDLPPDLLKALWYLYLKDVWNPFWLTRESGNR